MSRSRLTGMTLTFAALAASSLQAQDAPATPQATTGDAPTPSCGGAASVWIGNSDLDSDISQSENPIRNTVGAGSDGRILAFRVSEGDQVFRLEAQAVAEGDPVLELLDSDGNSIAQNDDAGSTLSSRIEEGLTAGDYCLRVKNYDGASAQMQVQVSRMDQPELFSAPRSSGTLEACTSSTEATSLGDGPINARLSAGIQQDVPSASPSYLRFTLDQPASLTLRATSGTVDTIAALYDGAGQQIAMNDDTDGTNSRLDFPSNLPAGEYCIGVSSYSSDASEGTINVSLSELDMQSYMAGAYRRGEISPPLGGDFPIKMVDLAQTQQEMALLGGSAQWYSVTVSQRSVLMVDAYGSMSGVDPRLAMFSAAGQMIAENDDFNGSNDSRLGPVLVEPGRYSIALTSVGQIDQPGAAIRPVMLNFEQFVPAK